MRRSTRQAAGTAPVPADGGRLETAAPLLRQRPWVDPENVFAAIATEPGAVFLDSADGRGTSIITFSPSDRLTWRLSDGGDPFSKLAAMLPPPIGATGLPFVGGTIALLGYELGGCLEKLPPPQAVGADMPELWAGLYDGALIFDHARRIVLVVASRECGGNNETLDRLDRLLHAPLARTEDWIASAWQAERTPADHRSAVAAAIDHIRAGDIYQANITQRFIADRPAGGDLYALYLRLRRLSPAPMAGFIRLDRERALLSASPERFLTLEPEGRVTTVPIKGTAARHADPAADRAAAEALQSSEKDRAENLMIVDLLRNDLARVCRAGSIAVPDLYRLESFETVHHLISRVTGDLAPGQTAIDLLRAAFPGGSVTGAPKIRAMQIINALEPARRGPYCGSLITLSSDGRMQSNILIRTLIADPERLIAQAGGGIVADSDPKAEHTESLLKVMPLLTAADPEAPRRFTP